MLYYHHLVSHKKTKHKFALKSIDKLDENKKKEKSYFSREIEIMYKLNHPNICKLFSHFEDNKYCYLLLQYIPKGSAFDLIPKNGKKQQKMAASAFSGRGGLLPAQKRRFKQSLRRRHRPDPGQQQ